MQVFVPSCYSTVHSNFVRPLLFTCAKTYGSAISSPSDASGVATFDNIGLFDLPKGAIFQVFIAVSKFMLLLCGSIIDIYPACFRSFLHFLLACLAPYGATTLQFLLLVRFTPAS
jgi:hypothetical protein